MGNRKCVKLFAKSCSAGSYVLECTLKDGAKQTVQNIVIKAAPTLESATPQSVKPGYNEIEVKVRFLNVFWISKTT